MMTKTVGEIKGLLAGYSDQAIVRFELRELDVHIEEPKEPAEGGDPNHRPGVDPVGT